jgi:nicotinate-nucleotide--dimethylbenzimidazole phosphoribosyltransferase
MCAGRASVNALAATVGARVTVLDVGVAGPPTAHPAARRARVRDGTADLAAGPAMTRDQAARAVLAGAGVAEELAAAGVDLLVTGDMGIANTTASACLVAAFTGRPAAEVTGPGAGADARVLATKTAVVEAALRLHGLAGPDHRPMLRSGVGGAGGPEYGPMVRSGARGAEGGEAADPLGVLAAVGGLEHAALVGLILAGAAERLPVVLDGVIAGSAALVATALCPAAAGYLVAGHRSTEPGAAVALAHLGLEPLLDLGLRLGEGTGALLAVPLVVAAARVLHSVATIDEVAPAG